MNEMLRETVPPKRLTIVDILRGFALMGIILLHNIEKFDFYYSPENLPEWIKTLDHSIWVSLFFLFGGKAYAIFALLFGFSFYIQMDHQAQKGNDFRLRFLWRLFLLFMIGILNSIFYQGDILALYAVFGLSLLIVANWSDKAVLLLASFLLLQPLEWAKIISELSDPVYVARENLSMHFFRQTETYFKGSSFWELMKGNLWNGRIAAVLWSWENGRFFQASALFMFGMLLGRRGKFILSENNLRFWRTAGITALSCFLPLFALKTYLPDRMENKLLESLLSPVITSWSNVAFMLLLVSGLIGLYQSAAGQRILSLLAPFGRMSLTNYVVQSIVGSFLYYGYGLGLYEYTGPTYCLLIGILLFALQLVFSHWWLKTHAQGPLERLWYKATWI